MSILQITKMTTDSGGDAHTLRHFNTFMKDAVKEEYQEGYRNVLKEVRFTARTNQLIEKARKLRDKKIAHSIQPIPGEASVVLTFNEIKEITKELTNLFGAASFDAEYHYLSTAYDPAVIRPVGRDSRPDIERILDSIARESVTLNLPEINPIAWPHSRQAWPPQRMAVFNSYRKKLGLPES